MGRPPKVSTEQILDTTRRLFSERGPSIALSEIAADLEISAPALIGRFGTKTGLLEASLSCDPVEAWLERLESRAPAAGDLAPQVEALWAELVKVLERQLPVLCGLRQSRLEMSSGARTARPPERCRRGVARWLGRAQPGQKGSDWEPRELADLLVSTAEGTALRAWLFHDARAGRPTSLLNLVEL